VVLDTSWPARHEAEGRGDPRPDDILTSDLNTALSSVGPSRNCLESRRSSRLR
jgi:hypothetical protein